MLLRPVRRDFGLPSYHANKSQSSKDGFCIDVLARVVALEGVEAGIGIRGLSIELLLVKDPQKVSIALANLSQGVQV